MYVGVSVYMYIGTRGRKETGSAKGSQYHERTLGARKYERENLGARKHEREKLGARKRERKSVKFKAQKRARKGSAWSAKAQARRPKKSACPFLSFKHAM